MGTRGLLLIKKDGKYVIAQYNHWDSYPSGLGYDIIKFFCSLKDWESFKKNLRCAKMIPKNEDKLDKYYRSSCISVLEDVACEKSIIIHNEFDFIYCGLCEWAYVVDFDKNTFEIYKGMCYSKSKYVTPPSDRFYTTTIENENNPKLMKTIDLNKLQANKNIFDFDFNSDFDSDELSEEPENKKKIKLSENNGEDKENNEEDKENNKEDKENNEENKENNNKAEWINIFQCSKCDRISKVKENYCPSCGKKML